MTRTNVREMAVHLVFEMNFSQATANEILEMRMVDDYYPTLKSESEVYDEKPTEKELAYLTQVVCGVQAERESINALISRLAVGWALNRINRIALAIMQVCIYEAQYVDDVPMSAAISEAVELTRKYEDEDVVAFVNGVLGGFAREVQPQ